MLQYNRIYVSERIDINETSESKECMLCDYWYFKDVGYKFQSYVWNSFHAVSVMAYELKNIAILNAKGVDCRGILWGISKNDVVDRLNNCMFKDKGVL